MNEWVSERENEWCVCVCVCVCKCVSEEGERIRK